MTGLQREMTPKHINDIQQYMATIPNSKFGEVVVKSIAQAASTTVVAALSPNLPNGAHLRHCHIDTVRPHVEEQFMVEQLWELSEKATGAKFEY